MGEPVFKQIAKTKGGYGFVLDKEARLQPPSATLDAWQIALTEPRYVIPEDIFGERCAECQAIGCSCPNEREVEHGTKLAEANGRIRELKETMVPRDRYEVETAMMSDRMSRLQDKLKAMTEDRDERRSRCAQMEEILKQSEQDRPERWYQDVAAEHMRTTLGMTVDERTKRLEMLLKHMAGR